MAPIAVEPESTNGATLKLSARPPLVYSGSLDEFKHFDVTHVIGTEFPELQLSSILADDNKIRDLAILGMLCLICCSVLICHSIAAWSRLLQEPRPRDR
jgi:hypothetical protein